MVCVLGWVGGGGYWLCFDLAGDDFVTRSLALLTKTILTYPCDKVLFKPLAEQEIEDEEERKARDGCLFCDFVYFVLCFVCVCFVLCFCVCICFVLVLVLCLICDFVCFSLFCVLFVCVLFVYVLFSFVVLYFCGCVCFALYCFVLYL